jgi:hypothetical protein
MNRFTRRKFLRTLAFSGTTAWAASRLGLLTNSGLAASPMTSQGGVLNLSLTAQTGPLSLAGRRAMLIATMVRCQGRGLKSDLATKSESDSSIACQK